MSDTTENSPTPVNADDMRCGFASVIGLPNAGKSTLVNYMVGAKVSIVSRKIQTTRTRLLGIALHENTQIILIDTPGIFQPKKTLEKAMVTAAFSSFEEADIILHIVDSTSRNALQHNAMITETLRDENNRNKKTFLVLNKIDAVDKEKLLQLAQEFNDAYGYDATFMVSALSGKGVKDLTQELSQKLPQGMWHYPEDQISDSPLRLMAAEITREKIFDQLHQEVPYAIFVETESWEEFDNGSIKISQIIHVQKSSQKGIILGKGGAKIKRIGKDARLEIEELLGRQAHLKLFVRVQENWAERTENYALFGLDLPKS